MMPAAQIDALAKARRINVVGCSGAGKSTFSQRLAKLKDIPYVEMDQLFWKPNWQEPSDEEFLPKVKKAVAAETWILDGNYSRTQNTKWPSTQVVVFLDTPFLQTIYRVTMRALNRSFTQQELWPGTGNRETLRRCFMSRDSIIWWAISNHGRRRQSYTTERVQADFPHLVFVQINSTAKADYCLSALAKRC